MNVFKIELMVIDFDGVGQEGIKKAIEAAPYPHPNHCIPSEVKRIETRDIGEWHDAHPLNICDTADAEYKRLFGEIE